MQYRLGWLNHWSTKREALDTRVIVKYTQESDGWYEHLYIYYFYALNDVEAKNKAKEYVEKSQDDIDIFSVTNRNTKEVILTEEDI